MIVRVKICCIASDHEVDLAIRLGAPSLGIGHEGQDPEQLPQLVEAMRDRAVPVLVSHERDRDAVLRAVAALGVPAVQLTSVTDPATIASIKRAMPSLQVISVVYVADVTAIDTARRLYGLGDAILLDTHAAGSPVPGGTGRTHDWTISARIAEECPQPVVLAGGLTPSNVGEAIRVVRPWGVDVCSGVRSGGLLDEVKLRRFIEQCDAAWPDASPTPA